MKAECVEPPGVVAEKAERKRRLEEEVEARAAAKRARLAPALDTRPLTPAEQQFLAMSGVLGGGGAVAQDSLQVVQTILSELEGAESPGEGSEAGSGADIPDFPSSPAPPSQLQHGNHTLKCRECVD